MIDFKKPPLHPSSEELTYFIDNKIIGTRQEEIKEHLLYCDACMESVANVMRIKQQEQPTANKPEWFNNINIIASGLAASLLLFLLLPSPDQAPFIEFYTPNQTGTFLAPKKVEIKDIEAKNQELNDFIKQLLKTTQIDLSQAQTYLKKEDWEHARESYNIKLSEIEQSSLDEIQKAKATILIEYHILLLSLKEGDEESATEYKDIIKDNIRRLKIREKQKTNR